MTVGSALTLRLRPPPLGAPMDEPELSGVAALLPLECVCVPCASAAAAALAADVPELESWLRTCAPAALCSPSLSASSLSPSLSGASRLSA